MTGVQTCALPICEVDDQKGVLLVEADPGLPARVTAIPLRSGRRLVTLRGDFGEIVARADEVGDSYVKVVLAEKGRVGLADEVRSAIPGALEVVLDDADQVEKRRPDDRRSISPTEAFHRYLEERGLEDPEVEKLFATLLDEVMS